MSSTKLNRKEPARRYRASWMSAATAVALVAGSATMAMAAPRSGLRTEAAQARAAASFNWQTFAPGRLVRIQPSNGASGTGGGMNTESLQAPAMSFAWQIHTPGRLVHNENPKGAGSLSSGDTHADALRTPVAFHWQTFAPGHLVYSTPSKGADVTPGDLHTDAIRNSAFRPTLVYGLGRDDAGRRSRRDGSELPHSLTNTPIRGRTPRP